MAVWTSLGDNTELFWVVLSHVAGGTTLWRGCGRRGLPSAVALPGEFVGGALWRAADAVCVGWWSAVAGWPPGPPLSRLLGWRHHGGGARATWCSLKHRGGASACAGFLSAGCFAEVVGASSSLDHERAADMVESGVSLHRLVDMMVAPLGCRNPCRGHHGEPHVIVMWTLRVKILSIWTCDGGVLESSPSWRRRIWGLDACVVVEVVWRCCGEHAWSLLLSMHRGSMGAGGLELSCMLQW
jgi:hypothetical protein